MCVLFFILTYLSHLLICQTYNNELCSLCRIYNIIQNGTIIKFISLQTNREYDFD